MSYPFRRAQRIADKFRTPGAMRPGAAMARMNKTRFGQLKSAAGAAPTIGELYIYEPIGWDCWTDSGITGKAVAEALDAMKGVKTLNVYINCEGGDVFEAKAIYANLKRFDAEKVIHIDGIAASAATFIAMAGDKIITSPVATWMVHEAWSGAMGRAQDLRAMADLLELESRTIAETYARRTKQPVEEMLALMAAPPDGTWMNATQALEKGFTDEIADAEETEPEAEQMAAAARSPVAGAIELTRTRLKSLTTGQLLSARADMHRISPGQPGLPPPASR